MTLKRRHLFKIFQKVLNNCFVSTTFIFIYSTVTNIRIHNRVLPASEASPKRFIVKYHLSWRRDIYSSETVLFRTILLTKLSSSSIWYTHRLERASFHRWHARCGSLGTGNYCANFHAFVCSWLTSYYQTRKHFYQDFIVILKRMFKNY